jgi:hypothetical protein
MAGLGRQGSEWPRLVIRAIRDDESDEVKLLLPLVLLSFVGFAAAGCGSGKKVVAAPTAGSIAVGMPGLISVSGSSTTTIADAKTGTRVTCMGWRGLVVKVPPPGGEVVGNAWKLSQGATGPSSAGPASSEELRVKRPQNGLVTVSCRPPH